MMPIIATKGWFGYTMKCECHECNCKEGFEPVDKEHLLNVIQHGRLNQKQIDFAMKRIDSSICEQCFVGIHFKLS